MRPSHGVRDEGQLVERPVADVVRGVHARRGLDQGPGTEGARLQRRDGGEGGGGRGARVGGGGFGPGVEACGVARGEVGLYAVS